MFERLAKSSVDRPVIIAGSERCGTTLLQSILNSNPYFLIWGEHNGFLQQIAAAYYDAPHPPFPDKSGRSASERMKGLRDARRWSGWDNLCGEAELLDRFRSFIRSLFADPSGRATRWGFKEIRYGRHGEDRALRLMFDCFPQTHLIILVREPEPTIFSVLSRFDFASRRGGNIPLDELDRRILEIAALWNGQYTNLRAFSRSHSRNYMQVRYEDLGNPQTYQDLARFLGTSFVDHQTHLGRVKDPAKKTDSTAWQICRRIQHLQPQIAAMTAEVREAFGYSDVSHWLEKQAAG